jgi:transcription elongation GreA/GreB family factor
MAQANPPDPVKPSPEPVAASADILPHEGQSTALLADVGDLVLIRYNDDPNRTVRVTLSRSENKPEIGIIHVGEPLAEAIMGHATEEEIEVHIGGKIRPAVIEMIERRPLMVA